MGQGGGRFVANSGRGLQTQRVPGDIELKSMHLYSFPVSCLRRSTSSISPHARPHVKKPTIQQEQGGGGSEHKSVLRAHDENKWLAGFARESSSASKSATATAMDTLKLSAIMPGAAGGVETQRKRRNPMRNIIASSASNFTPSGVVSVTGNVSAPANVLSEMKNDRDMSRAASSNHPPRNGELLAESRCALTSRVRRSW